METGYFLVADVLGFSGMIANTGAGRVDGRIRQWVSLVESEKTASGVARCHLFSDTVFASAPPTSERLKALTVFARGLLTTGLENSFMVRGGIATGSFTWGELTYGRAIIEAHKLESRQNWIGVCCQAGLPHIRDLWGLNSIVCYVPPMKSGPMRAHPAIAWSIPDAKRFEELVLKSDAIKEGELLSWEIGENSVIRSCSRATS